MSISFKFNYKVNKMIVFIYLPITIIVDKRDCFDLFNYSNLIMYIIVIQFSIILYIYYFIIYNEHKIKK